MTVAELRMGAFAKRWGPRRIDVLNEFIRDFDVVFPDDKLCTRWAQLRADLRTAGRPLSVQDAWIAATAIHLDVPLATNNRRDFDHIPQLQLLDV